MNIFNQLMVAIGYIYAEEKMSTSKGGRSKIDSLNKELAITNDILKAKLLTKIEIGKGKDKKVMTLAKYLHDNNHKGWLWAKQILSKDEFAKLKKDAGIEDKEQQVQQQTPQQS